MRLAELESHKPAEPMNPFYISFSDLMVLLCVFFVLVVGMSKIDVGSYERMRSGLTGTTKGTLVELSETLKRIAKNQKGVSVRLAEDGVRLDLESAALFDSGSSLLKVGSLEPLTPVLLEILKTKYSIDIEGHTDDVPLHRVDGDDVETNWSLSGRRASSVIHYLLQFGFNDNRLRVVGYASSKPKISIARKQGRVLERARAKNRRVSLLVK